MAEVITSVGTSARDYSTWTLWEADDGGGTGSDDVIGEGYDDSAFVESVEVNTTTPISLTMRPATGEGHDGTAGTGVRIVSPGSYATYVVQLASSKPTTLSGIEIDGDDSAIYGVQVTASGHTVKRCIVHAVHYNDGQTAGIAISNVNANVLNTIIYDVVSSATGSAPCCGILNAGGTGRTYYFLNNTIYGVTNGAGSGPAYGMNDLDSVAGYHVKNNIVMGTGGATSGAILDFDVQGTSVDDATNMSSDDTADDGGGSGNLINQTAADQFVSITGGMEDLHLKSGSDAIGAGTDLGTSPTGVEIDIDGRDRDAQGDTWDMGAHQFVGGGGGDLTNKHKLTLLGCGA